MESRATGTDSPLLRIEDLVVQFPAGTGRKVHAVSGVSLHLAKGETLGLVGESGCGKSSLARAIMQLPAPTAGRVVLGTHDLTALSVRELRPLRSRFQMIFQDPVASLNPSRAIGESIEAPLRSMGGLAGSERQRRARNMLASVGLNPEQYYARRPFQLSGGQCQRVSIARALMTEPQLLVCDEPVSALDVSVQAQIINLLRQVKAEHGLGMLFISHDLAVVKNISDRVAVMYMGQLCEVAPSAVLYRAPFHPYTKALLAAIPHPDPHRPPAPTGLLPGDPPSVMYPPAGCRFRSRCPVAESRCRTEQPALRELSPGHLVACHLAFPPVSGATP